MLELAARQVVWAVSMARHERPWLAMWQHPPLLVGVAGPIIYWMASWKRRYTARESPG
jgi:hypothetical protein